jgi:hypothetical protein
LGVRTRFGMVRTLTLSVVATSATSVLQSWGFTFMLPLAVGREEEETEGPECERAVPPRLVGTNGGQERFLRVFSISESRHG